MKTVRQDPAYSFAWVEAPSDLEEVFSPGHQYHGRIVYDRRQGQYYDKASDLYLSLDEAGAYGLTTI